MPQASDRTVQSPPLDVTAAPPRRRRWVPWVAAATVLVVAVVVAGGLYVGHYQPLRPGSGAYGIHTTSPTKVQVVDNWSGTRFRIIAPKAGDRFEMFFALANSGPLSVSIDGVEQPFYPQGKPGDHSHPHSTTNGQVAFSDQRPNSTFQRGPFTLAPGESVQIRFTFSVPPCATSAPDGVDRGGTLLAVRYHVLGISHTQWVDVGRAYSVASLPTCPDKLVP